MLIHGSLGTGAFSNSPALYRQFNVPPDPLGSTSPCSEHGIGDPIPLPTQVDGGHCEPQYRYCLQLGPLGMPSQWACLQRDLVTDPVRHGCPPECTKVW